MNSRSRRAFTLIEILVVVAIIALLVAILLPSLSAARESAASVVCRTRLTELFKGHAFYAQDQKNHFPDPDWWLWDNTNMVTYYPHIYDRVGGSRPTDSRRWLEFGQIYKYVKNKEVYFCPRDTKERLGDAIGATGHGNAPIHSYVRMYDPHYFYRLHLGETADMLESTGRLRKSLSIGPDNLKPGVFSPQKSYDGTPLTSTPYRTALIFEEFQNFGEPWGWETTNQQSALNDGWSGFIAYTDWVTLRHRGKSNTIFWDGHSTSIDGSKFNHYGAKYGAWIAVGGTKNFTLP
jgi:prepilin-type N-terminal cleavage/methylation domain-containing protein/prepilin-type processing-associated H-X9-DG protein